MKKIALIFICSMLFLGCASHPPNDVILNADYGPPPNDYRKIIKDYYSKSLFDPYSAQYTFSAPPRRDYDRIGDLDFGWVVCGTVNAKNRMGGYVGAKPFYIMIKNNNVIVDYTDMGSWTEGACRAHHGPDDPPQK